jgi:hypothetical protein
MISRAANPEIAEIVIGLICENADAKRSAEQNLSHAYHNTEAAKAKYKQAIGDEDSRIKGIVEYTNDLIRDDEPNETLQVIPSDSNTDLDPNADVPTTSAEVIRNYQVQRTVYFLYLVIKNEVDQLKINPKDPEEFESAKLLEKILYGVQFIAEKRTKDSLEKLGAEEFMTDFDNLLSKTTDSETGPEQSSVNPAPITTALPLLSLSGIELPQDAIEKEAIYARHELELLFLRRITQNKSRDSLNTLLENTRLRFKVSDESVNPITVFGHHKFKDHISVYGFEVPSAVEGRFVEITDKNEIILLNRNSPTGFYAVRLFTDSIDGKPNRAFQMEITEDMREDDKDVPFPPNYPRLITPEKPIDELTLHPGQAIGIVTGSLLNLIESIAIVERLGHQYGYIVAVEYNVPNDIEWPINDSNFPLRIDEIMGLGNLSGNKPKQKLLNPGGKRKTPFINVFANGVLAGGYDIGSHGKIKFVKPDRSHKRIDYSKLPNA